MFQGLEVIEMAQLASSHSYLPSSFICLYFSCVFLVFINVNTLWGGISMHVCKCVSENPRMKLGLSLDHFSYYSL